MLRRYSVNFELFSIFLDAISISIALSLAGVVHSWLDDVLPFIEKTGELDLPGVYFIVFPAIWIYLNLGLSLYDGRVNMHFVDELYKLVLCTLLATISLAGLLYFVSLKFSHSLFGVFILMGFCLMGGWRSAVRLHWRMQYSYKQELRRVLVVGAGETGRRVAFHFTRPPESNLEIVGFLDDDPEKLAQLPDVLGSINDLDRVVDFYHINILIIALPSSSFALQSNIVDRLRMKPVKIWIVPSAHRLSLFQCEVVNHLSSVGIPLIDVRAPAISDKQRLIKRLFDIIVASISIVVALPFMVLIALLIKLDSPGPIFFRQKRVGENTQPFEMLKFRTMVQNAEALGASVVKTDANGNILHKRRDDPRVTRIGRFLRRYSIDELPQIFNVLLGKMSLVGPRPEMPYLVEKYKNWQYVRFTIPQGMTGWWQVTGRSDKPMHLNTEDDLYYIKNYSIWLDIRIILKTFRAVIAGRGAY